MYRDATFCRRRTPADRRPVYVSVDLDALGSRVPRQACRTASRRLTVRDLLAMIHGLGGPIVGADVVECNPSQDLGGLTAVVAAKITRENRRCMLLA